MRKFSIIKQTPAILALSLLIVFIVLYFKNMQLLAIFDYEESDGWSLEGFIKSICSLCFMGITLFLFFKKRVRLTMMGKCLLLFALYYIYITSMEPGRLSPKQFMNIYLSMSFWVFVYLFFYLFFLRYKNVEFIRKAVIAFFLLFFVLFLMNYVAVSAVVPDWHYIEASFCLMMLPFVFLLLTGRWRMILFCLVWVAVILSAKRSCTVACIMCFLGFYFMKDRNLLRKVRTLVGLVLMSMLLYFLAEMFFKEELTFLVERFYEAAEDGGSGRDSVYAEVLDYILKSSGFEFVFGHGYNTVIQVQQYGYSAHNDFLEVAYDYGLIGFTLYILVYVSILCKLRYTRSPFVRASILASFVLMLVLSFTSHLILYTTSIISLCAFWGYIDANKKTL